MERSLLVSAGMTPDIKKPVTPPAPSAPEDVDFAEEAGPKDTEFKNAKDVKAITAVGFDPIP